MSQTLLDVAVAAANYAANNDFRQLRLAVAGPRSREQGPYCYTTNGTSARERRAGVVARRVRDAAVALGMPRRGYRPANWCGRWPRTQAAWEAEYEGAQLFFAAVRYCAQALREAGHE